MATKPTAPNLIRVPQHSQDALYKYLVQSKTLAYMNWNTREKMRNIDVQYARESDYTEEQQKAKLANRMGDTNKFQNITVPVIMPQVEAAVTYQTSVFLSGIPLFGCVAEPEHIDAAKQMETIIDHQSVRGGWSRHLMMAFRDAFKYNFGACEVDWYREMTPSFSTDIANANNSAKLTQVAWEGNKITRLDMYNTFWDSRYAITEVSAKGEFAGYSELISRVEAKLYFARTPNIISANIKTALESPTPSITLGADSSTLSYYIPQVSQTDANSASVMNSFNWMSWAGLESKSSQIEYKNIYEKTTLYARIIPSDFSIPAIPAENTPQIWKMVFINNVLIYAQPCSYAIDVIPILFLSPNEDGLRLQTKSLAQNGEPFQAVASAMMNSVIHSRRRAISDRVLYDPSKINPAQINSDNPSAKIPIRPAAYGKPISEAVYQFPYRDDQSQSALSEISQLMSLANQLNGQNQAKQGQFVKGNKTLHEYQSVMANANGRDQLTSLLFECQFFTPLKELLKLNILEKQTPATLYSRDLKAPVSVNPVELRKASIEFKVSDGLMPSDKLIGAEAFSTALQTIGSSPQIGAAYNIGPMFSYLMKTQGADIEDFEKAPEQLAYEQASAQWQSAAAQVSELAKTVSMKIEGVTLKDLNTLVKSLLPAQPNPTQYGYKPGMVKPSTDDSGQTILSQVTQQENSENGNTKT